MWSLFSSWNWLSPSQQGGCYSPEKKSLFPSWLFANQLWHLSDLENTLPRHSLKASLQEDDLAHYFPISINRSYPGVLVVWQGTLGTWAGAHGQMEYQDGGLSRSAWAWSSQGGWGKHPAPGDCLSFSQSTQHQGHSGTMSWMNEWMRSTEPGLQVQQLMVADSRVGRGSFSHQQIHGDVYGEPDGLGRNQMWEGEEGMGVWI